MSKYPAIRRAIMDGEVDEFLDEIAMAIVNRRREAGKQLSYQLELGDFIRIAGTCKPKMLANQLVIFRGWDPSRIRVELTQTYSPKWTKGKIIRIPPALVGRVMKQGSDE